MKSRVLGCVLAVAAMGAAAAVPKVIFDTDMISDFDDVGAMACLHALADAGECEILATVSSTRGNASVAAVEVINGYYGRGDLPTGAPKGMGVMGISHTSKAKVDPKSPLDPGRDGGHYKYRKLAADYPQWVKHLDADDAPDANLIYRKALASAPDKSVVICTVGFATNVRRLLETPADDISPLTGRELVARKVVKWVAMACRYTHGSEYNSAGDAASSRIAFESCPVPIVFTDWEYGFDIFAGRAIAEQKGPRNPVKDVFAGNIPSRDEVRKDPARWMRSCFGMGGRSAWDETAVLIAVRGEDCGAFNVNRGTYRMTGRKGENVWIPDEGSRDCRVSERLSKDKVGQMIDELICRTPKFDVGKFKTFSAAEDDVVLDGFSVGPVKLMARERGAWKVDFRREAEGGVEYAVVEMTSDREDFPAAFNLSFNFPKRDTVGRWKPSSNCGGFGMYWNVRAPVGKIAETDFRSGLPLCACYSAGNRNRFTFAASESSEPLVMRGAVREEDNRLYYAFHFYDQKISRRRHVVAKLRIDARDVFWSDAVREGADWMTAVSGRTPAFVPDAAFAPLYSTWYNFHQDVFAEEIERECAIASGMGMKTLIVDDGWQTDDTNRGYAYCGDWKVSKRRFPDMKAHVAKVHSYGMKYMLWYSVPFVGDRSENLARFKGKFLYHNGGISTNCLDPRFPEVREFLIGTYEKAVREWDIDGLKLDFIDAIHLSGKDPALQDNFAGRDFKSVTAATEKLLADVYARLKAIKPDILVEYRQPYVGPSIRAGANMLRVSDCPANPQHNRTGIVNLRLTSGATAVHADMLEWHPTDTPEAAALNVLSCMFGTVQYSMKLAGLDAKHVAMIGHWSRFGGAHVGALQRGKFRAYHPELNYPLLEGEDAKERIFGVYAADIAVKTGPLDRTVYVLNATEADSLVVDLGGAATVAAYDTWGKEVLRRSFAAGPARLAVPPAGYLEIAR